MNIYNVTIFIRRRCEYIFHLPLWNKSISNVLTLLNICVVFNAVNTKTWFFSYLNHKRFVKFCRHDLFSIQFRRKTSSTFSYLNHKRFAMSCSHHLMQFSNAINCLTIIRIGSISIFNFPKIVFVVCHVMSTKMTFAPFYYLAWISYVVTCTLTYFSNLTPTHKIHALL